ncbi:MAG: DEAD/DEAH box helicase [Planctomycetota bacterium]
MTEKVRFADLDISEEMLELLEDIGYEYPTDIQAGLIPLALEGYDVLGQARTGTGKTASFVIPILEQVAPRDEIAGVQAIILVPTRELAVQVHDEVVKLADGLDLDCVAVYGGTPIRGQIEKLKRGAEVVVGTPGRVLDHISRGTLQLNDIWCVVLDEADRMLDIGFRPDIEKILRRCPRDRQTLLLSATVPPDIKKLAERYMVKPKVVNCAPQVAVETIEQFYFTINPDQKFDLLVKLIEREQPKQAIVFCRTKRGTDRIAEKLGKKIQGVSCIHGDMGQGARDSVMRKFRAGNVRYLVATDVVGRGIDVSSISHIINFDIPEFCDDYVHRVGRTGRMGREGVAYTFVCPHEGPQLTSIEQRIDRLLKRDQMPDLAPSRSGSAAAPGRPGPEGQTAGAAGAASDGGDGAAVADESAGAGSPPRAGPAELQRRGGKRYRRAL